MAESREVELTKLNEKYKHQKTFGFIKMKVITGGFAKELFTSVVEGNVEKSTTIKSDASTSYSQLNDNFNHQPETIPKKRRCKDFTLGAYSN